MFQRIWLIPNKLAAEPFGTAAKIGKLLDDGVMLLNTDYPMYEDARSKFRKVCIMPDGKLAFEASGIKKAVTYNDNLFRLAAKVECERRILVNKLTKEKRKEQRAARRS